MSAAEKPKPEQIQANVAAALSRLRGELGSSNTPAMAPKPAMEAPEPKLGPVITIPAGPAIPADRVRAAEEPRGAPANRPFEPTLGGASPGAAADNDTFRAETPKPADFLAGRRLDSTRMEPTFAPEPPSTEQPDLLAGMEVPPASPPPLGALEEDLEVNEHRRKRRNRVLVLAAAVVVVIGAGWGFLHSRTAEGPPPVITADTSPEKVKPADEGGMQVPNQNVQILDNLSSGQSSATVSGEGNATVLPAPEQPVAPPAAEQNAQAGTAATAPSVTETPPATPAPDTTAQAPAQPQADQSQAATAQTQTGAADSAPSVAAPAIPSVSAPAIPTGTASTTNAAASTNPVAQSAAPEANNPAPAAAPAKPAAVQTAAAPTTAPKPVAVGGAKVQLAAVRSEEAARTQWTKLQKLHPDLLGALSLNIQKVDKSGVAYYRIQAGPLTDKAKAKQLCARLVAQKQDCIVAR